MFFASWFKRKQNNGSGSRQIQSSSPQGLPIFPDLEQNKLFFKQIMGNPPDLIFRDIMCGSNQTKLLLIGMNGLVDKDILYQSAIKPLVENDQAPMESLSDIENTLHVGIFNRGRDLGDLLKKLLTGNVILLMEKQTEAIIINAQGFEERTIEEPKTEPIVRGPHEGFTEALGTNLALMRRRLHDPMLRFDILKVGIKSPVDVCVLYIQDIAAPEIVEDIKNRIRRIKTEAILGSGYIEEYIDEQPQSLFATVGNTERPDKLAGKLLEGRVGILVDGTPTALWLPYLFLEAMQSPEDYYSLPFYTSFIRMLRYASFWISLILPAFYVGAQNFHKEMIPTTLLASIAAAREGVPFPLVMEVIFMLLLFEILKEAGVRMPRSIGQAVSIVGALILGDAAVQAGIVGTPTIIVVALAGITTFIVTPYTDAVSLLRILLIIPASILGLFGLLMGVLAMLTHLASMTSAGVPYLSPFAPTYFRDWKDTFVRVHLKNMDRAPESIPQQRKIRHEKP
ncbi:spore germination protein [Ferviditalea candida]|uniref:Spore germination protein n=1 Tax=Ferviditalea candida TaxID=3108399 RepID=A0ABU5ZMI3_9BACL|nr:spore germination protein [Paenibacillaceae bacterium T2]